MPLTFAHPAVILPFSRKSRFINFSAMVIGSMSPDFEYFLKGQPSAEIGHTFAGFVFYNLPLVMLVYFVYHYFIHQTLLSHLPVFLQDTYKHKSDVSKPLKIVVFCYSALFGMFTHVAWDSFTHMHGFMVLRFPTIFASTYNILGYSIPVYKLLQHGSTIVGIMLIIVYLYVRALHQEKGNTNISAGQKLIFWTALILLTIFFASIWYVVDYVPIISIGVLVVRIIDSFLISLLLISLYLEARGRFSCFPGS